MFRQCFLQAGVPTVICRSSWIHAEDDVLTHLTVAGESFGAPVWQDLMSDGQRAQFAGGTSGIGEACTELFARSGANVLTMSIQPEAGESLAGRLTAEGRQCIFQYVDAEPDDRSHPGKTSRTSSLS